ncbi:response regulator transcription factor [Paenibacillus whitsoniae]|uniref:Response regulator n=1 Tax=Paenibacillus whitsoniae TaxID=2496558 RepID=A0A430JDX7_9BACL|nr:response regulator [Paenibacillus whitsoniae]RTE09194.1 response regulator [Paenibacillus whitsoniae]
MKIHLLIVDDEVLAIEGVKSDLDLTKLGISQLFTAINIRQAKELFERERIDILLCDIEMPQGSGFELLTWVREHHPNTVTIFFTSHADFKYAKEALQLGSVDYLLKPVRALDLEAAIFKAQAIIKRNSEFQRNSQSHQLWLKHHAFIIERFWVDLINHSIPSQPAAIRDQVDLHHIPITEESVFLPILISVQKWKKEMNRRDEKILEYALKNSAEEILIGDGANGICFHLDRGVLLVIMVANRGTNWDYERLYRACERYIHSCNAYFYCDLSCYFGNAVEAYEMAGMVAQLRRHDRNNVAFVNQVFLHHEFEAAIPHAKLPALGVVASLMKTATKDAVIHEVESIVRSLINNHGINAEMLHQFNQNFTQVVFSYLNLRGIEANQLFGDEASRHISESAVRSISEMLVWVRHAVSKAMIHADAVKETEKIVQTVKAYISLNLDQDMTREMIADQVFLHPDYLTRIFKKETGLVLSDYIVLEKVKVAKELLSRTERPVSAIASTLGYTNFSYFTKLFKKHVGVGPMEYRSQNNKDQ